VEEATVVRALPPDYCERRGERVLLVWGDFPHWMVVDRDADRFIGQLARGEVAAASGRDAAEVLAALRQAGVVGSRRAKPPRERIESLSVNVTNRCNLRCRFCYNADRAEARPELPAEAMIAALESVRRWTAEGAALALLGGEPLLEPEKTLALAAWGRKRGLRAIVSTNGLLVDEAFARSAAGMGLDVQVSIDGASPETHEAIRGTGTFGQAIRAVQTLVACGAHTIISLVFHAGNAREIPAYLRLARSLGAQEARFIPIKQVGAGAAFSSADLAGVIRLVRETLLAEPRLRGSLGRDYFSILAQTCQSCALRQGCGTGSQTLVLDAGGTVYPCPNLAQREFAAGNVGETSLRDIWLQSPVLREVRSRARVTAPGHACAECFVRHWCLGGCRGEAYAGTGRLEAPSVTCKQNRASVLEMMWTLAAHPELLRSGVKVC
jgi:radical SAM protein with 4Fe4S-binding SPASM domain